MYNGNELLRAKGQKVPMTKEQIGEYIRCKEDIIYFAEKYFYIMNNDQGKILIPLYDYQKKMLKAFLEPSNDKRHNVILASRQIGKTTIASVFITHFMLFNDHKNVGVLANKEKTSLEILLRIKTAIQELPMWLQQGVDEDFGGWAKSQIGFENGIRIIGSSTASNAMRTYTIGLLYLDEFAFVPDNIADDFMRSVYPTISSSKTSKIIIVSTPNGMNHFHAIWRNAVHGNNNFMPIQVRWQDVPGYDEKWRGETIADIGPVAFAVEYGGQFLGSRNTLIDPEHIERMDMKLPIDLKMGSALLIYEHPRIGDFYILGVDSAKGTGKDYSVIQVLKIVNEHEIVQVAMYRDNKIEANDFAQVVISVSKFYNDAYMMVENNDVGGEVANAIWNEYECDKVVLYDKKGVGVRATKKTKLAGNLLLKRYIENGWLEIIDKNTITELSKYEEIAPNIFKCPRGVHDDCAMALIWGLFFLTSTYFDGKNIDVKKIDDKFLVDGIDRDIDQPIFFDDEGEKMGEDSDWDDMASEVWGIE